MSGPLDGVRVIDLTTIYSGPIATSILGDHGADVVKIEAPGGEAMRPGFRHQRNGVSGPFAMMNRNKRSLVLDLSEDSGKRVLERLLAGGDVVVENFRPGVMERLGFGWDRLQTLNSRLIYASINGVGPTGPYANRRVYDAVIQAISGMASLQADPKVERPQMINTLMCDKLTSITAAQNICSALYAREKTGRGQRVEISMLDSSLFFLWPDSMGNFTFVGDDIPKTPYGSHAHFVRQTKDGYIATMPVQPAEWSGLFTALELDALLADERFATPRARQANSVLFQQLITDSYARFTTAELVERLSENEVPFAEINSREAVIEDPQVKAMGALVEFEHPFGGAMRQPRPPGRFSDTETDIFRCSPQLGEHTDDVLDEYGFDSDEIQELRDQGTVA
ncbi:MAG: CoA transferase [Pseudomonadota bacterium]|uniref:CoA transferase n=1 Tax=marine metagenome TaxID=408172 RepID=A0A381NBC2_9ZZZZ|nr:CoA transferase [Pseudomonadota bacterium]